MIIYSRVIWLRGLLYAFVCLWGGWLETVAWIGVVVAWCLGKGSCTIVWLLYGACMGPCVRVCIHAMIQLRNPLILSTVYNISVMRYLDQNIL